MHVQLSDAQPHTLQVSHLQKPGTYLSPMTYNLKNEGVGVEGGVNVNEANIHWQESGA